MYQEIAQEFGANIEKRANEMVEEVEKVGSTELDAGVRRNLVWHFAVRLDGLAFDVGLQTLKRDLESLQTQKTA